MASLNMSKISSLCASSEQGSIRGEVNMVENLFISVSDLFFKGLIECVSVF